MHAWQPKLCIINAEVSMKYIKQLTIILLITLSAEILRSFIPFKIPATIYGLVLLVILLKSNILKLDQIKDVSSFLLNIMPILYIPALVGLMNAWSSLKDIWIPFVVINLLTTLIVMVVSGHATQALMHKKVKHHV
jgi:holin-like protein